MFVKMVFHYHWNMGVCTLGFVGRFSEKEVAEAWVSEFSRLLPAQQEKTKFMPKFEIVETRDFGFQFAPDQRLEMVLEEMTEPFEVYARRGTRIKA